MMRTTLNILIPLILAGVSSMASAQEKPPKIATLEKAEGTVMVDKGKGFASAKINTQLTDGDRVVTVGDSIAEIVFNDGCKATLKPNNLIKIERDRGCKAIITAVDSSVASFAAPSAASSLGPVLLGIGAVIAISGNDDKPISGQ